MRTSQGQRTTAIADCLGDTKRERSVCATESIFHWNCVHKFRFRSLYFLRYSA